MDAHEPVTLEEGDRYPLGPPSFFEATAPGHFLARALGPATVASLFLFHSSTAVVQETVNLLVVGSIPACGANLPL